MLVRDFYPSEYFKIDFEKEIREYRLNNYEFSENQKEMLKKLTYNELRNCIKNFIQYLGYAHDRVYSFIGNNFDFLKEIKIILEHCKDFSDDHHDEIILHLIYDCYINLFEKECIFKDQEKNTYFLENLLIEGSSYPAIVRAVLQKYKDQKDIYDKLLQQTAKNGMIISQIVMTKYGKIYHNIEDFINNKKTESKQISFTLSQEEIPLASEEKPYFTITQKIGLFIIFSGITGTVVWCFLPKTYKDNFWRFLARFNALINKNA